MGCGRTGVTDGGGRWRGVKVFYLLIYFGVLGRRSGCDFCGHLPLKLTQCRGPFGTLMISDMGMYLHRN